MADATLMFEILSNTEKEPRQWALLNHPVTETPTQWAGFLLWQSIKKRHDAKAIRQEIFILKLQTLNTKCMGNAKAYIMEIQELRKRLFQMAGGKMCQAKAEIFDQDLIQAVLLNLPGRFQAFITIFRADPNKILISSRNKLSWKIVK